jgi:GH15 family glucan-1,4-alpha-glucosidase
MYNMEWVRDDVMMVFGMLAAGFHEEARTLLVKVLENSVGEDGRTIESSRWVGFAYAELDQNGQLLAGVSEYLAWTGDIELVKKYWETIRRAGDHPLMDVYMDKTIGMMHNRREFWERSDSFGFEDGYELAYQFWVSFGLEAGAGVAEAVADGATASRWRTAAVSIRRAMLEHPKFRLIEEGRLIKRRTLDGRWQRYVKPPNPESMPPGSPIGTLERPEAEPDTSETLPILWGMVDPRSGLARATMDAMERLWNQRWQIGGYARYNTDSEPDPPAPWPFASLFIARAYAELRDSDKVWRVLRWLADVHGGRSGGWFERYGPSITPPAPPVCMVGWNWAEVALLVVRHLMGFRPGQKSLTVSPFLLEGISGMSSGFRVRGSEVKLKLSRGTGAPSARVNGRAATLKQGRLEIPYPLPSATVTIDITL